jgi:hypothetical protein
VAASPRSDPTRVHAGVATVHRARRSLADDEGRRDPVLMAALVAGLVSGLASTDAGLRLRCSIALARVARSSPELLGPHTTALLASVSADDHPDVQWQLALVVPRLVLDDPGRSRALALMERLFDESPVGSVRANALEAVVELARGHPEHEASARRCLDRAAASPVAAVRTRAVQLQASAERGSPAASGRPEPASG